MTDQLKTMIAHYKNIGERVDEVLYQEVMKTVERVTSLEEKLGAKILLINNGWEEERYSLQEENMQLREDLSSIKEEEPNLEGYESVIYKIARQALEGKRDG